MENQALILVVDDDPNIRELLVVNLAAAGYRTAQAQQGKEALAELEKEKPCLVILDVMMPEMDGWELCKKIKDDPELDQIKVLMLTARDTDRDKMIGRDIFHADRYLTKPFDVEELLRQVGELLHE